MKHAADDWAQAPTSLRDLYAPSSGSFTKSSPSSPKNSPTSIRFVNGLIKYGVRLGGKRLRPALVLLSGQAGGRLHRDHLPLAAAVEMIHTATLVHDDVLDEATLRRHMDTVNSRWNNETSVLLGDYLLSHALCLASSASTTYGCRCIGQASRTVCEGELRQIAGRGNYDLPRAGIHRDHHGEDGRVDRLLLPPGGALRRGKSRVRGRPGPVRPQRGRRLPDRRRPVGRARATRPRRASRWAPIWQSRNRRSP